GQRGPGPGAAAPAALAWVLSARSEPALRAQASRLAAHLDRHPDLDPVDVGFTLARRRARLEHRAAVVGRDRAQLRQAPAAVAAGGAAPRVTAGRAYSGQPAGQRPVLLFPGQGTQWSGMAVDLLATSPAFAAQLAACQRALEPFTGWSLTEVLADEVALGRVDVVQPALWAVMVSLSAAWRAHGVEPAAVVGHSQGEIAAATVAGALSLEDG